MKRIIAMLLAALMLLSMAACGGTEEETPEVYVPSEDIEVAVAFVSDGKAKVVTRRTSDKELTSIDLYCVYYNAEGQVGEGETIQCDFATEGKLSIWTFTAAASSQYMEAAVSSVTYADGTKQTCPGVSTWADAAVKAFSVDNYTKKMAELASKEATAAQVCEAVAITLGTPADSKLGLGVKNNSGKEIDEVVVYLLWFDADGAPIDMGGVLVPNSEKISAKTLAVDEDATYTATAPENAAMAKAVVQSVTFTDETVWENDYIYEWAVVTSEAVE